MRKRYTPKEWLAIHGERYKLKSVWHLRRQCRGDTVAHGHVCRLPRGWRAERLGRSWGIRWTGHGPEPEGDTT